VASIDRMSLLELLRKSGSDGDVDFLKEALNVLVHSLMEWHTRVGTLDLSIPKLRKGSYFPSLLEPRKRAEKALLSVVQVDGTLPIRKVAHGGISP